MPQAHITSKGQITLPKAIRDHLKVKAGDLVAFSVDSQGKVTVEAVTVPITTLKGMICAPKVPVSLESMDAAIRRRNPR